MKRLIHHNRIPYGGGYSIDRRDLGMVGEGTTFDMLVARVSKYRKVNGIPIGLGFESELESVVCDKYPVECRETDQTIPPAPRTISYRELLTGTMVMVSMLKAGRPLVSQEEANRRAGICRKCIQQVEFTKPCGGLCPELKRIVTTIVGVQKIAEYGDLKSCNICGCYLTAAIWIPLEIQIQPLPDHVKMQFEKIPHCWKKQSLIPQ